MTGCERCNTVNTAKRHVYIVLFKGDDSDFAWNQNIEITLETEMDLTDFRAKFSFMDFTQEFADITSKKLVLVFPATATSSFPLGAADASIVLYDSDGKARTIANRIHMIVTKCVDEAYANEDPQAITVSISSSMEREQADWDETDTQSPSYIRNKPEIPTIDATLTKSGKAADAKAVGEALDGKRELDDLSLRTSPTDSNGAVFHVNGIASMPFDDYLNSWASPSDTSPSWEVLWNGSATYGFRIGVGEPVIFSLTSAPYFSADVSVDGGSYHIVGISSDSIAKTSQIHSVPGAYTSTPEMDGVGSAGSSNEWAKGNHVHPSDTNKVDGDAIYPEWMADPPNPYPGKAIVFHKGYLYQLGEEYAGTNSEPGVSEEWGAVRLESLKQDALSESQLANIAAVPNKADATDIPYRLVTLTTPTVWLFSGSGVQSGHAYSIVETNMVAYWNYVLMDNGIQVSSADIGEKQTTVDFSASGDPQVNITATLSGYALLDRAGNRMEVSGDTTLTLPAAVPGYLRDFLVRLEISGSTVPTITFAAPTGETITYETDGDEFPVPDEAGSWLYSFTESCVAHKFAVSLKKVNTVATPQAQGGS